MTPQAKNAIALEQEESRKFQLETYDDGFVKLSLRNVAMVEAFIRNDSNYLRTEDESIAEIGNVKGSTAFWMALLRRHILENEQTPAGWSFEEIIAKAVEAVDRENSTHLNADKVGRQQLTKRLFAIDKQELTQLLKDPAPDYKLVKILSEKTEAEKGRVNYSFATKFCHYACMTLFKGTEFQDNFSIYDNIVSKAVPAYIDHFKLDRKGYNPKDYTSYIGMIDQIREASGSGISRNGFDHLLWYFYKGHPELLARPKRIE